MRLVNKVAIITGAGQGQGEAAFRRFVKEGAAVLGADLNGTAVERIAAELRDAGGRAEAFQVDVTDSKQVAAMVDRAVEAFGKLDILYNNAGFFAPDRDIPIADLDEALWDKLIAVNLKGPFLCAKYAIPKLIENGGGSIINIASTAALLARYTPGYSSAKTGLLALTRSIALSYARDGIRCNAVCPGAIQTPMLDLNLKNEERRRRFLETQAIDRVAAPEEVTHLTVYLASDESSYMTGSIIPLDGGATLGTPRPRQ
jgi:NAD(P)-dependent dehydrogenase (short-subunit alcohol dehydrogenase family)